MRYQHDMRAADADRERVAERLRGAHADGRIDTREFEQRLDDCYAARTYGDLAVIVNDLPPRAERTRRPAPWRLVPVLVALVAVVAAWHALWLVWVLVALAVVRRRRCSIHRFRVHDDLRDRRMFGSDPLL